jgi:nuclear pore complex protein Nup160
VDGCLELVDLSLDASIHSNGVRIKFGSCKHLPGGISIRETRDGLYLLVATSSQVHRFVLPAPGEVEPSSVLPDSVCAASVLASFQDTLVKPNYSTATIQLSANSMEPHAASTWSSLNGDAWFALASLDGTIKVVFLPADSSDRVVQFELKMTSMMQRLWNGIVPLTLRGSAVSSNAVSSVCLQEIGGDLHALAVCRDLKLRIWSLTTRECVESTDLTLFIPDSKTVQPSTGCYVVLLTSLY